MERSLLAAVLLGVLAVAFPGAAAAVGTQPGAMAKASREPSPHVSLSCAPASSFAGSYMHPALPRSLSPPFYFSVCFRLPLDVFAYVMSLYRSVRSDVLVSIY